MNNIDKKDILMTCTFASLALSLVTTLSYMIYAICTKTNILTTIILLLFTICLVITGFFIDNKKAKIFIIIASLLLTLYSITQIIININTPKEKLPDFTNYDIKEVIKWSNDKKIKLIKEYEYNDEYEKDHIIKQDIKSGTYISKIKKLKVTISNGIDMNKITKINDMVGWNLDDVIKFIDDNKLTNINIKFEFSNSVNKDIIISQDIKDEIKLKDKVNIISSLGKEINQKSIVLDDLVGLDLFHAQIYLGRNNIKYNLIYNYSEDKDNIVLKQSIKPKDIISSKRNKEITLTIGNSDIVTIPDLKKMNKDEVNAWANDNHINIKYEEEFDDSIKENYVISYNRNTNENININDTINVIISKGKLEMIDFTSVSEFEEWAKLNNVSYNISYSYSSTVEVGEVISSTHRSGDIIKNNDTVKLVISEGSYTTIPNLIGKTVSEAKILCNEKKINCNFKNDDDDHIIIKQQMKAGTNVPNNTTIDVD